MKPLVSYVGAKSRMIRDIDKILPKDIVRYFEPFVGGGSVLFHVGTKYPDIQEFYINDLDVSMTTLYKTVKSNCNDLVRILIQLNKRKSKEDFLKIRDIYNRNPPEPKKTALYVYLLKLSFNSNLKFQDDGTVKPTYSASHSSSSILDAENYLEVCRFLRKVKIYSKDYIQFIGSFKFKEGDFVFLYPPYYVDLVHEYYKYLFDLEDYRNLLKVCDWLTDQKVKWLLTVNVHKDIKSLFQKYKIKTVKRHSFISSGMNADSELFIRNY